MLSHTTPQTQTSDTPATSRRDTVLLLLFAAMLAGSLLQIPRLPLIEKGISNLVVPLAATGIILLRRWALPSLLRHFRLLVGLTSILFVWMWIVTLVSPYRDIGFSPALKYTSYLVSFTGLTLLLFRASEKTRTACLYGASLFLFALAVVGFLEYLSPTLSIFYLLRHELSLTVYPRLASIVYGPNQFGVLMSLAAALGVLLSDKRGLSLKVLLPGLSLVLLCLAHSGSRNGWIVYVLSMSGLLLFRKIGWLGFTLLMCAFWVTLLSFDLSVRQLGLEPNRWIPFLNESPIDPDRVSEITLAGPSVTVWSRVALWREAVAQIAQRPLTGIGVGVFQEVMGPKIEGVHGLNAHSLPLNLAVELGLVGLVLVAIWCLLLARLTDWRNAMTVVPMIPLAVGQLVDYFAYDYAFMVVFLFFIAACATSRCGHES